MAVNSLKKNRDSKCWDSPVRRVSSLQADNRGLRNGSHNIQLRPPTNFTGLREVS